MAEGHSGIAAFRCAEIRKSGVPTSNVTQRSTWTNWFVYRKECVKTTWGLRLTVTGSVLILAWLTSANWTRAIAHGLVCSEDSGRADAVLVENFDADYLLFERAEQLQRAGRASRVLVTTFTAADGSESRVHDGVAELMAGIARLKNIELLPLREIEPISLNAANQIRDVLDGQRIKSVAIVTSGFRSTRSFLVYRSVLSRAGIEVSCVPVFGQATPESWAKSWHGIQNVTEQFFKLQYYRFYVLPADARKHRFAGRG